MAGKVVVFEIESGKTEARFAGGRTVAFAHTSADGKATAPRIIAGVVPGVFTISASLGKADTAAKIWFDAVIIPTAPVEVAKLASSINGPLALPTERKLTGRVIISASSGSKRVAGYSAVVQLFSLSEDRRMTLLTDNGPFFKDRFGEPTRDPLMVKGDRDGRVYLPEIFTDRTTGLFRIRIIAGKAVLDIDISVLDGTERITKTTLDAIRLAEQHCQPRARPRSRRTSTP
ncbi:hypothetical protein [Streptomyces sp. NPDC048266]|uniref:hypothetical protein n=1 Tax=Streptomyces sp. NPDC048266 TaxID=3155787 RepID=UPI0033E95F00